MLHQASHQVIHDSVFTSSSAQDGDATSASKLNQKQTQAAWEVLDTAEQWQQFSRDITHQNDANHLVESTLLLNGLHCSACSGIIERGLLALTGVEQARVSMAKNRAVVTWSPSKTKPSNLFKAIQDLGYQASPANQLAQYADIATKKRATFWRWMVAGFCMMQVMMYATPSYFAHTDQISTDINRLLNWASWLLSLPVLLFSSSTFFKNAWNDLTHCRISMDLPVALGISITFIVSSAATFNPSGWWGNTVYFDTMTMLVFFLLSARLVEARLHTKTTGALESLLNRIPENTLKQNIDGTFSRVLNSQLSINAIVQVNVGESFPADGTIISGETQVDESLITGESTPIAKAQLDHVLAGSYNLGEAVNVQVTRLGESTQYGKIVRLIEQASLEKPRLVSLIDRFAKHFLLFVLLSAGLAASLIWPLDHARALMTAATVLIVTCPCALSLATPTAMLASASAFVSSGILIKNLQAIENIANIDTVIFDKTGTLTNDQITVTNITTASGFTEAEVLNIAHALAKNSLHPISRALIQKKTNETSLLTAQVTDVQEVAGAGIKGVISNNNAGRVIKLGTAKFCGINVTDNGKQQVYLADDKGLIASFALQEEVKPNSKQAIKLLKENNLSMKLLSGDHSHRVAEIAHDLEFESYQAACSPQDKLTQLEFLKSEGKKILMVGDGLNDGPVLASAHASIAMGKGVPLTHAHADYILLNGDISQIPALILHAKKTMQVIKQNITWAIVYNLICIPLAFFGLISAWQAGLGMALSSLIVVFNAVRLGRFKHHDLALS